MLEYLTLERSTIRKKIGLTARKLPGWAGPIYRYAWKALLLPTYELTSFNVGTLSMIFNTVPLLMTDFNVWC